MSDLTVLAVVLSTFALGIGLKLLKVEPGSDKRNSEIYGRDIAGMIIIVLAFSGGFFSLQSLQVQAEASGGGGGGPALYPCNDVPNQPCYIPGNSGLNLTTICRSTNSLCPPFVDQSGECTSGGNICIFKNTKDIQYGTTAITINPANPSGSNSITFGTAYAAIPSASVWVKSPSSYTVVGGAIHNDQFFSPGNANGAAWTIPVATTEWLGGTGNRLFVDTSAYSTFQLSVDVVTPGAATCKVELQYSTDQSTWNDIAFTLGNGDVPCSASGVQCSSGICGNYQALAFAAIGTPTYLRLVGIGGDGATAAAFGTVLVTWSQNLAAIPTCSFSATRFVITVTASVSVKDSVNTHFVTCGWLAWTT